MLYLAIDHSVPDHHKEQEFDTQAEAEAHITNNLPNGFVVPHPGGRSEFWIVDMVAKTIVINSTEETIVVAKRAFQKLRRERNIKLAGSDWWASSDLSITQEQKDYRQALRDLPANTADPTNITWPEEPGS